MKLPFIPMSVDPNVRKAISEFAGNIHSITNKDVPEVSKKADSAMTSISALSKQLESLSSTLTDVMYAVSRQQLPKGSIYLTTDSLNPAALLGYGVWEQVGKGKTIVGVDTEDEDFDAPLKEGGTKDVTLATPQIPAHSHPVTDAGHDHYAATVGATQVSSGTGLYSASSGKTSKEVTGITINNAGGGEAHNNMPPFFTCYIWRRVA